MSTRPPSKGSQTHQRILQAAKRLFAAHGFSGTTTRQIAAQAGTNEALIFRHFPTKRDLYSAIIQLKIQEEPSLPLPDLAVGPPPDDRAVFRAIAGWLFDIMERDPDFIRLLYFSALEGHELSHIFFETYVDHVNRRLRAYIAARAKQRAFKSVDSFLAARAFLGMIGHHLLVQELFAPKTMRHRPKAKVIAAFVDIFLSGVEA